jgi:acyl-CoA synthetase (AMP-forming)/AMP-acid ligase II
MDTIPAVLRAAAEQFGAEEAIVDSRRRLSFTDVSELVGEVERALIASGISPGDRVGIWAPNSADWIIASFAIYGVGAVLVPINTRFKAEEAADVLRTAEVDLLFTVTDFLDADYVGFLRTMEGIDQLGETVILSGSTPAGTTAWEDFLLRSSSVEPVEARDREAGVHPDDPSDIIFTSGTTGRPKGAVLRHGASVGTYVQWSTGVGVQRGDRMLVVYPFFHTAGLKSGVLACFIRGATIVPHPVFDVTAVVAKIAAEKITVLPGPPSVFQSLLDHPEFGDFDLSSLRLSVTGAAVVPVELIARMRSQLALDSVITAYGLTETHGTATICEQTDTVETIATTVGHPLSGLELRIEDDDGQEVPVGTPGEVLIRGFNLMTKYFHAPQATAIAIDGEGWLHTGDVGIVGDDGYLRIIDRKKDIVIVGGFNVSPAEVESIILRRPDIAQAAVVGVPDARLGEVTVGFLVPASGHEPEAAELITWCRAQMANYKAPRVVHLVERLPTNPSGKVLKQELRERAIGPN